MKSYILHWPGKCDPPQNQETISVPEGKVVYMTRAPQVNDVSVTVTNCTTGAGYLIEAGGDGNSAQIPVSDQDVLCFSARSSDTANSVMINVTSPRE